MVVVRLDQGVRHRTLSAKAENGVAQRRGPPCVGRRRRRGWVAGDGLDRSRSRAEPVWRSGRCGRENQRGGPCAKPILRPCVLRLPLPAGRVNPGRRRTEVHPLRTERLIPAR